MNVLADLALEPAPTPEARLEAEKWALRAITTLEKVHVGVSGIINQSEDLSICDTTRVAVLFNLGSLAEVRRV